MRYLKQFNSRINKSILIIIFVLVLQIVASIIVNLTFEGENGFQNSSLFMEQSNYLINLKGKNSLAETPICLIVAIISMLVICFSMVKNNDLAKYLPMGVSKSVNLAMHFSSAFVAWIVCLSAMVFSNFISTIFLLAMNPEYVFTNFVGMSFNSFLMSALISFFACFAGYCALGCVKIVSKIHFAWGLLFAVLLACIVLLFSFMDTILIDVKVNAKIYDFLFSDAGTATLLGFATFATSIPFCMVETLCEVAR